MNPNVITVGPDGLLYGIDSGALFVSTDGGVTKAQTGASSPDPGTYGGPSNLFVTDAGFVLTTRTVTAPDETGSVFFADSLAGPWELVFTTTTVGAWFDQISCSAYNGGGLDLVLLGEYGRRAAPKTLWLSTDGGVSYSAVLETVTLSEDANNHIHCARYDPHRERIWCGIGDGDNATLVWSDDLGDTWETHPERLQPTAILPLAGRTVFGIDEQWMTTGAYEIVPGVPFTQRVFELDQNAGPYQYGIGGVAIDGGRVGYMSFPRQLGSNPHKVMATGDGGDTWHEVYSNQDESITYLCGPDQNGWLYGLGANRRLLRTRPLAWKRTVAA